MLLTSPDFADHATIPSRYTCEGQDYNPALEISKLPAGTETLVLIMDDPDAPHGTWDHWIVYDIPPLSKIERHTQPPGTSGTNSWGRTGYGGPCPPIGTGQHRYFFKVYALDTSLNLPPKADKASVEHAMQGHILEQATLVGLYEKKRPAD